MARITFAYSLLAIAVLLAACGCEDTVVGPRGKQITITVTDKEGNPIAGAGIEGGVDWTYFSVETDSMGNATVYQGERGTIFKTNFFPRIVYDFYTGSYALTPTPRTMTAVGTVSGTEAIIFDTQKIVTLGYSGEYHVYSYGDDGTATLATHSLAPLYKQFKITGDSLWYTTHDQGIYCYSISDLLNPIEVGHWDLSRNLNAFAVKDTLLVLAERSGPGPVELYALRQHGEYATLAGISNYSVQRLYFRSHYLIALGNEQCLPTIFDISDLSKLEVVYNGLESSYVTGLMLRDKVILRSRSGSSGRYGYQVIDVSDPARPIRRNTFSADADITHYQDYWRAVGTYYFYRGSCAVLDGNIITGLNTVAVVSRANHYASQGAFGNYYIINNKLWRLSD